MNLINGLTYTKGQAHYIRPYHRSDFEEFLVPTVRENGYEC